MVLKRHGNLIQNETGFVFRGTRVKEEFKYREVCKGANKVMAGMKRDIDKPAEVNHSRSNRPLKRTTGQQMFCRHRKFLPDNKGFTLLEVLVAITILLLVILPLANLYVKSLTVIQNAALYSQAIQLGQERMDLCEAVRYEDLKYFNEVFSPGFPYTGPLPASHNYDYNGDDLNSPSLSYDNRNCRTSQIAPYL